MKTPSSASHSPVRIYQTSRPTATRYLEELTKAAIVRKTKTGRSSFYINEPLFRLLAGDEIETVAILSTSFLFAFPYIKDRNVEPQIVLSLLFR